MLNEVTHDNGRGQIFGLDAEAESSIKILPWGLGRNQTFEAETEADTKILSSRVLSGIETLSSLSHWQSELILYLTLLKFWRCLDNDFVFLL